jgi:superfamily II DNA or RNA helicase
MASYEVSIGGIVRMSQFKVCSVQTLARRNAPFSTELLIVDECHQRSQYVVNYVENNPQAKVIGLTATPFTKGLNDLYQTIVASATDGRVN